MDERSQQIESIQGRICYVYSYRKLDLLIATLFLFAINFLCQPSFLRYWLLIIFYKHIFQMQQNLTKKELRQIGSQIDQHISKIDQLLLMLSEKQLKSQPTKCKLSAKEIQKQWNDIGLNEGTQQLNQTCQQTDYNHSGIDMCYNFEYIWDRECEDILLDDYNCYDCQYIKEINPIWPKQMVVSTKSNWINNFLDESDSKVMLQTDDGTKVITNIEKGYFKCIQIDNRNQEVEETYIESQQIYKLPSLFVQFPRHLKGYQLKQKVASKNVIYEMTVQKRCRILIQCQNQKLDLIRLLIIKSQGYQNYEIIWGTYTKQSIFESLIVDEGKYILMPLPSTEKVNLYLEDTSSIILKKDFEYPIKSFNLLKKTFEECRYVSKLTRTLSITSDQEGIKKEFMRSCYMNFGIVLQIYQNIYDYQAKFMNRENIKQDIRLLFDQIYTAEQIQNRYYSGQKIIKFYVITQKPANLYIPNKKVIMGNREMENHVYHAVFK